MSGRTGRLIGLLFACAAIVSAQDMSTRFSQLNPAFGTSTVTYDRLAAADFQLFGLAQQSNWSPSGDNYEARGWGGNQMLAHPHLPAGARLESLELVSCDSNASSHLSLSLFECDTFGSCNPAPLAALSSADNASTCDTLTADLSSSTYTVDNRTRELILWVDTQANDGTNQFAAAVLGYTLQVSPSPGMATFDDVPVSHPFFQFVEALAASGITAGCGGGDFCPDSPVTRGQMAVFLAKALGLNWSQ